MVSTKFTYLQNFLQMTIFFINITSPPWSLVQVHQTSSSASSSSRALLRRRLSRISYSSLLRYLSSASRRPDHQRPICRRAMWNSSFNKEHTTMTNAIRPPSWPRSANHFHASRIHPKNRMACSTAFTASASIRLNDTLFSTLVNL